MKVTNLTKLQGVVEPASLLMDQRIDVLGHLRDLLPGGSLKRGSVGVVYGDFGSGATSMIFSLISQAISGGSFVGLVGLHSWGFGAAADMGIDLRRLLVVECGSNQAIEAASLLLDGFDIVVLSLNRDIDYKNSRSLANRARVSKSILVYLYSGTSVLNHLPYGADFSIWTKASRWELLGSTPVSNRSLVVQADSAKWPNVRSKSVVGL
ncbi:MAG: hypothetical protein M0T78_07895 [Actinomycetota bacterium]|jgi:hypothetical protein|nr:hypothetical protein [Actinomycetota bacterium]